MDSVDEDFQGFDLDITPTVIKVHKEKRMEKKKIEDQRLLKEIEEAEQRLKSLSTSLLEVSQEQAGNAGEQNTNIIDVAKPKREIFCCESVKWLKETRCSNKDEGYSYITSLPDVSETSMDLSTWKNWFVDTCSLIMSKTHPDQVCIFYQTDIKVPMKEILQKREEGEEGEEREEGGIEGSKETETGEGWIWIDKSYLVQKAAERANIFMVWHKIALIVPPGIMTPHRPGYTHVMCFSKKFQMDWAQSTADVFDRGGMQWPKAMGMKACEICVKFVKEVVKAKMVVDPFCGSGSVLIWANQVGLDAIGVDLSTKRCSVAQILTLKDLVLMDLDTKKKNKKRKDWDKILNKKEKRKQERAKAREMLREKEGQNQNQNQNQNQFQTAKVQDKDAPEECSD